MEREEKGRRGGREKVGSLLSQLRMTACRAYGNDRLEALVKNSSE